jgi:hypothetical protein
MWICWEDPNTGRRQRIYNYHDPNDSAGQKAIQIAREALAYRFGVEPDSIPDFRIEPASWERLPLFIRRKKVPAPEVSSAV